MLRLLTTASLLALCAAGAATAQEIKPNLLRDVYFGNLHVHSGWSFDAYINGSITTPDSGYRWAKGEAISGGEGLPKLQILRPLDWYAVSDPDTADVRFEEKSGRPLAALLVPLMATWGRLLRAVFEAANQDSCGPRI
jgi:hypothetical protein